MADDLHDAGDDLAKRLRDVGLTCTSKAADRIEALEAALTQSRAETAAAYDRAAGLPRYAPNSFGFMNPSDRGCWVHHGDIRALSTPDQTAALDAVRTEARAQGMREAAKVATSFLVGDPINGIPLRNPMAHEVAEAILAAIKGAKA